MYAQRIELSHRDMATLRAVAAGRVEITCSRVPDLYVDGLPCCDQTTSHQLASRGLVAASRTGARWERVPALLTSAGRALLAAPQLTAA